MRIDINFRLIAEMIKKGGGYVNNLTSYKKIKNPDFIPLCAYSTSDYKINDVIRVLEGNMTTRPLSYSIKIHEECYVVDEFGKYICHSNTPNAIIKNNLVIALKDIKKYEEITINNNNMLN